MGALFQWIIKGLAYAGPAAVGYFFNDVATWISGLMPQANVRDSGGRFVWWFVLLIVAVVGAVALMILNLLGGKKKLFVLAGFAACCVLDQYVDICSYEVITAGFLGSFTLGVGVKSKVNLDYCPEVVMLTALTATPQLFTVEVKGFGTVLNLGNAGGLNTMNEIRFIGDAGADVMYYRLGNGRVNQSTTFTLINGQATSVGLRGNSKGMGTEFFVYETAKVFANVIFELRDFAFLALPNALASDRVTIEYTNGFSDDLDFEEVIEMSIENQDVAWPVIDNYDKRLRSIRFTGDADQDAFFIRNKPF